MQNYEFKPFTRDSLANIKLKRRQPLDQGAFERRKSTRDPGKLAGSGAPCQPEAPPSGSRGLQQLEPDPYLASGQLLPHFLARQMPSELVGKPIEDLDPYYADKETFVIISRGKELTRFSASKALCLFGPFHPVRRIVLFILINPIFNLLIVLTILLNCIVMTFQEPKNKSKLAAEATEERYEIYFTAVYTIEMLLKILARGFIVDDFTYMRDAWNWLDFVVIATAYLTMLGPTSGDDDSSSGGSIAALRSFRVLRALKTMAIIPGMKTIVGAVIDSVKNLKDVVVLTLFSLSVFSLMGLQIYMGLLTQKCHLDGHQNMSEPEWLEWSSNRSNWLPDLESDIWGAWRLCGNATGAAMCPPGYTCLQGFGPNPDYGFTNFDDFGWASICSFRLMTQDNWEQLYLQVIKTAGTWHIMFFLISIFLGSIYLMNLILAIVAMSYNELQRRAEEEEEAAAEEEAQFLENCRLMELEEQQQQQFGDDMGSLGARSNFRPSVEIGLVGQSMLVSLCQGPLMDAQLTSRLMEHMAKEHHGQTGAGAGAGSALASQMRSHSLYAQPVSEPKALDEPYRTGSGVAGGRGLSPRSLVAASALELRRRSSMRSFVRAPQPSASHQQSPVASSQLQASSSKNYQQQQQQAASNGSLSELRKRAALIRIVSDDYSSRHQTGETAIANAPDVVTVTVIGTPDYDRGCRLQPKIVLEVEGCAKELRDRVYDLNETTTTTAPSTSTATSRPQEAMDTGSNFNFNFDSNSNINSDETYTLLHKLGPNLDSESDHGAGNYHTQTAKPVRFRDSYSMQFPETNSDMIIRKQPKSIHQRQDISSTKGAVASRSLQGLSSAGSNSLDTPLRVDYQADGDQTPTNKLNLPTGGAWGHRRRSRTIEFNRVLDDSQGADTPPTQTEVPSIGMGVARSRMLARLANNPHEFSCDSPKLEPPTASSSNLQMHHLSVENFQQFGVVPSSPRGSFMRPRVSMQATPSGDHSGSSTRQLKKHSTFGVSADEAAIPNQLDAIKRHPSQGSAHFVALNRRLSHQHHEFKRRASNWSRISVSGPTSDTRRLLRLWAHTNPYQAPTPTSRSGGVGGGGGRSFGVAREGVAGGVSPCVSDSSRIAQLVESRAQSQRPSSVGSARQAYELFSAMNRRRSRYPMEVERRYAMAMADETGCGMSMMSMMDDSSMSVSWRDKSLAYCLSCLDVFCIWECCDSWILIQRWIALIVFDPFTDLFIILCIVINTLFMALDSDDADANMRNIFEKGNYFFTATFAVEALMKIMALSPKFYFREGWNVFDSLIVGLSLLELSLEGVIGLSVLRSFRLLRVFKLAKSWPTLNLLISIMGKAIGDLGNLTFVLAIIVFIFAVMGMQLFGAKYEESRFPDGQLPRWNFRDFMHSFMIVFRILCAEWVEPMWDCLLVAGWPCIPFFLIAVVVGNLVVLNLFLALLLASFGASNLSSPQNDSVDTKKLQQAIARLRRFAKWFTRNALRLIRLLLKCLLCNQRRAINKCEACLLCNRNNESASQQANSLMGKKSHIVAMSKMQRIKNIEAKTEALKNKCKRDTSAQGDDPMGLGLSLGLANPFSLQMGSSRQADRQGANPTTPSRAHNHNHSQSHNHKNLHQLAQSHVKKSRRHSSRPLNQSEAIELYNRRAQQYHYQEPQHQHQHQHQQQQHISNDIAIIVREPTNSPQPGSSTDSIKDALDAPIAGHQHGGSLNGQADNSGAQDPRPVRRQTLMQPIKEDSRDADSSEAEVSPLKQVLVQTKQEAGDATSDGSHQYETEAIDKGKGQSQGVTNDAAVVVGGAGQQLVQDQDQEPCELHQDHEEPKDSKGVDESAKSAAGFYLRPVKNQDMDEEDERTLQYVEQYIDRCVCLGLMCLKWFLFRQRIRKIVEHRYFDQCILILVVISSGTLALEDKNLNERPTLKQTLDALDTVFTIIFSLEMILKWLAFGIRRYFGNIWSWLDFVIVMVSFINLMASIFGSGKIQALKTMRTLRAMRGLRPLRALQRFQGMRVVVNALIQAIPSIFNVLLVCLIFWLIFSIMGVQMFGGKFWRCLDPETGELVDEQVAPNRTECLRRNLNWSNPQINFDNVPNAYLALFQVATFQGWVPIMDRATDSRVRDEQPSREANLYMYFYFVFFTIFGSFFTLNLFIGVIIDNFNEQKKKTGGSLEIFMTEDQKKYYHAMKKMKSKRPMKAMTRPKLWLQAWMFDITTSKKFDMTIMLIIGLNMFVMALEHYGQSQEFSNLLELLNIVFIIVFTLECLCKIFAMRHFYFREPWNIFDFIVVNLSILGVVMKEYVAKYFVSPTLLRVVRVVKVGRVLRLVKGAKGIRTLLFALAMSLPALFNICLLLFLVMFIYAIFGMSFFMNVRKRSGIDETFNFETFSSSILVLFQMSTSAGWDLVLDPLMDEENDCQKPDPANGIEGTCGNKAFAIAYLISYVIVTFLIIINMYIAVILENYSQATEDVQEGLTDDDYEMYYEIWQKFDPDGTQYLPYELLSHFVDALEDPLRIAKPNELALVAMDINIYEGNRCYCVDILDALTKHFFARKGLVIQVNEQLEKVQSILHVASFEKITTTFMLKRQHYCAKVIQKAYRRWRERATLNTNTNNNNNPSTQPEVMQQTIAVD